MALRVIMELIRSGEQTPPRLSSVLPLSVRQPGVMVPMTEGAVRSPPSDLAEHPSMVLMGAYARAIKNHRRAGIMP